MFSNLQLILFFVYLVVEGFKNVFICRLDMGNIVVYCIIIISNRSNNVANCMELGKVEGWLI